MTFFTIVDFKKGYWMVVLHPDSRKLTCMALPFGRFQWPRLPMGTVVAQDIFQSKLDAIFIGMEGVTGIADDMVIAGKMKWNMTEIPWHSWKSVRTITSLLMPRRFSSSSPRYLSMDTAGQNKGFHWIQRRLRHWIIWSSHWTRKL